MVKFNYITECQVLATSILNSEHVFLYFTPSFFCFRWEVAPSTVNAYYSPPQNRISKILRKKNTLLVHFTWNFLCEMYVKGAKYYT